MTLSTKAPPSRSKLQTPTTIDEIRCADFILKLWTHGNVLLLFTWGFGREKASTSICPPPLNQWACECSKLQPTEISCSSLLPISFMHPWSLKTSNFCSPLNSGWGIPFGAPICRCQGWRLMGIVVPRHQEGPHL